MGIDIPSVFAAYNLHLNGNTDAAKEAYAKATAGKGTAGECIACGQCEGACPQHILVIKTLEQCAKALE